MKNIICFDAEFANLEILELSVYSDTVPSSGEPKEIFHSLFKPETERRWPGSERVHHISPAMVRKAPYFRRHRTEIQSLIDSADCLVGFAIENDIEALRREGVEIPEDKPLVDVRDLHWVVFGHKQGIELDARKGLGVTAGELSVEFKDEDAHGASYDTLKTLECFHQLIARFSSEITEEGGTPDNILELYQSRWDTLREEYLEEFARGWVSLIEVRDGYRLKTSRVGPPAEGKALETITVNARWKAMNEIDARLDKKRHPDHPTVYKLKPSDIDWFRSYTNTYDADEPVQRRLYDLRQQSARMKF